MNNSLVNDILVAAGQPVAGHTLSISQMQQAINEERVLQIDYWSNFGDGEASFCFAKIFGLDYDGSVHPSYIVFPKPIPLELRIKSERCLCGIWDSRSMI